MQKPCTSGKVHTVSDMIDIHTHILPGVDDGPRDWEETIALLEEGIGDGITGAVCTSHVMDRLDATVENNLQQIFTRLEEKVRNAGLPISLWLGSEIHCQAHFDHRSRVATLNGNGKYLLIEFPMNDIPYNAPDMLFHLSLEGISPILAHPERNAAILRKPDLAYNLSMRGILFQLNAGSLTGQFGRDVKHLAFRMIENRMAHFIASDCHRKGIRPMHLKKAYHAVLERWDENTAAQLFEGNPKLAVSGESIQSDDPLPFTREKKSHFFFKLRTPKKT